MNPRIVLKLLLERLESKVGDLQPIPVFWAGSEEEAQANANLAKGRLHLARAVSAARRALASDDDIQIVDAAIWCQAFERTGNAIEHTGEEIARHNSRQAGGKRRQEEVALVTVRVWQPWRDMYFEKLAGGMDYLMARRQVKSAMIKAEFRLPDKDGFPAEPTIRKWLPNPKKITARS